MSILLAKSIFFSPANDYIINQVVIPPSPEMYRVNISLEIVNDQLVEQTEYLTITFLCEAAGVGTLDVLNNVFGVNIQDNDGKYIIYIKIGIRTCIQLNSNLVLNLSFNLLI